MRRLQAKFKRGTYFWENIYYNEDDFPSKQRWLISDTRSRRRISVLVGFKLLLKKDKNEEDGLYG